MWRCHGHRDRQWWSIVQVVTWIVGRSLLLVERASGMRAFSALRGLRELGRFPLATIPQIPSEDWAELANAPAMSVIAAQYLCTTDGRVMAGVHGRRGGIGTLERVAMQGHLQALRFADGGDEVAACDTNDILAELIHELGTTGGHALGRVDPVNDEWQ